MVNTDNAPVVVDEHCYLADIDHVGYFCFIVLVCNDCIHMSDAAYYRCTNQGTVEKVPTKHLKSAGAFDLDHL